MVGIDSVGEPMVWFVLREGGAAFLVCQCGLGGMALYFSTRGSMSYSPSFSGLIHPFGLLVSDNCFIM